MMDRNEAEQLIAQLVRDVMANAYWDGCGRRRGNEELMESTAGAIRDTLEEYEVIPKACQDAGDSHE